MSRVQYRHALVAAIAAVIAAAGITATLAMRRNATTFDEIFMVASGARGWVTGDWSMTLDHPPVMQYLYGAAAHAIGVRLPEEGVTENGQPRWGARNRFVYAQEVYFRSGNDPEHLAFATRLVGVFIAMGLGAAVAAWAWSMAGPLAALLAAALTMFMPDILAHAGITYNDVPLALIYLLGLWAWDTAIRRPTLRSAALAAVVSGIALGIKFSALALGAAAFVLFVMEAVRRPRDGEWQLNIAKLLPVAVVITYLTLVLVYRGDFALTEFRWGIAQNVWHARVGHGTPALLLGRTSTSGFWYFFPVAIVLKTPAALHALAPLAIAGYVLSWRNAERPEDATNAAHAADPAASRETGSPREAAVGGPQPAVSSPREAAAVGGWRSAVPPSWLRALLSSPLRAPTAGALVFLAFLLKANLNIGIRHALPLLPLLTLLVAVGAARLWRMGPRLARWAVGALTVAAVASSLVYYPFFLTYFTEYVPFRKEMGYRVMVDSNLDWGQGLLELRDWMREHGQERVYLSYFGSALPDGYGIGYVPLQSFFPLRPPPQEPEGAPEPDWLAVSATNLAGTYLAGDPFAQLRTARPDYILANSMYVFHLRR